MLGLAACLAACSTSKYEGDAGADPGDVGGADTSADDPPADGTDVPADAPGDTGAPDGVDAPVDGADGGCPIGEGLCVGGVYHVCVDGEWEPVQDCAEEGLVCDEQNGCVSPCKAPPATLGAAGCEFWAVDLDNAENAAGDDAAARPFAVAVANAGPFDAEVEVLRDESDPGEPASELAVASESVPAGQAVVIPLPRLDVDGPSVTDGHDDGPQSGLSKRCYRVVSSSPVLAYQFNPYEDSHSNDATMLLPTHALGISHHVIGWPPANPSTIPGIVPTPNRAYVTIVATADSTTVTVTPAADVAASVGTLPAGFEAVEAMTAGEGREFTLGRYEVLNLETPEAATPPDLSGTTVVSNHDVAVFSGVDLGVVTGDPPPSCSDDCSCCADHMHVQIPPDASGGRRYVVSRSPVRSTGTWVESDHYRIVGLHDMTTVTTSLAAVPAFDLDAAEVFTFTAKAGFVLESSADVLLARVLASQQQTADAVGDPSMMIVPGVGQRRTRTVFVTAQDLDRNRVVVSLAEGASATIDGSDVASTCAPAREDGTLASTVYRSWVCAVEAGTHTVDGAGAPVGVDVYAYSSSTSVAFNACFDPI
jgi:hypothetical protein